MSHPVEVFLSGTELKVILGDAQIHLRVAHYGEPPLGKHLVPVILHTHVLEPELLLVHGRRSKQSRFHAPSEPGRRDM